MTQLGKYDLHEQLGKGGFGTVYRATDTVLGVERALKVLHPALVADETFISRFKQEAQIAARLEHPNLVPVYDFGETDGRYYLAMKFMPGGSLKDLLAREGRLDQEHAFEILQQVAEGIGFAHKHNIIHRDLKPGNILFDQDGAVRVSDMGFAKALSEGNSTSLSATGGMIGTPSYMAPEIWRGKPALPASDIYSLGCILYEMLTGKVLFEGESPADVMTRHVLDGPQFSEELPEQVSSLIHKALERDPEDRYKDLQQLLNAVERINRQPEPTEMTTETKKGLYPKVEALNKIVTSEVEMPEENFIVERDSQQAYSPTSSSNEPTRFVPHNNSVRKDESNSLPPNSFKWIILILIGTAGFIWFLFYTINLANQQKAAATAINSTIIPPMFKSTEFPINTVTTDTNEAKHPFGQFSLGWGGVKTTDCVAIHETTSFPQTSYSAADFIYFASTFLQSEVGNWIKWEVVDSDGLTLIKDSREIRNDIDLCFWQGIPMSGYTGKYSLIVTDWNGKVKTLDFTIE